VPTPETSAEPFGKTLGVDMLAVMATFAERVAHALKTRGMRARGLELMLNRRFGKRDTTAGYVHRILKKNLQPPPEVVAAIAEDLKVSERWLLSGKGSMDRDLSETPTYDSLAGWAEAAEVETARGRVQGYAIRAAGRSPAFVQPEQITPDFVFRAAMFWLEAAPEAQRTAAMDAEARRIKDAEDARRRH
jgi:hypothetical protein